MKLLNHYLLVFSAATVISCGAKKENIATLKDSYKDDFYIGTALDMDQINEKDPKIDSLVRREYNAITAENNMKSMYTQPEKGKFDFSYTDAFVKFGEKNNMFIHGHTLIWHSQLAPWMRAIKTEAEMQDFLNNHITTVVSKHKGRIHSWDVVNEALNEDGTYRKSVFLETMGDKFLVEAFKLAAAADPKADLYYNDYNMCDPKKREGAIRLVKHVQANGGKVDGIGMQGHWNLVTPSLEEIEKSIVSYAALGVKVAITELDITVLPNPWDLQGAEISQNFENTPEMNPYPNGLPAEVQAKLAKRYEDIFKIFLKHKDKISRVTFWGSYDKQSWLNGWPIRGRTNYPLLIDANLKHKEAYNSVINLKKNK